MNCLIFVLNTFKDAEHLIVLGISFQFSIIFSSRVFSIICSLKCLVKLLRSPSIITMHFKVIYIEVIKIRWKYVIIKAENE